ncbi:unnamed protein product [Triticum turgidum subsp. durum]|uniref:Agmatine coumaroyltransferase-2 n=1 Tax=Triticum turgidum subsp. durum TaxID=4567 RepID=A0A9R1P5S8_TRITD|nr:unnamed protein product [Triticum turgidum subsp. durum]
MKITVHSSKAVKPDYGACGVAPGCTADVVPLTVLDKANFDTYISVIYAFHAPAPPNDVLEAGLARVLVDYREWAGRLGVDANGERAILLNDAGARFVEATADVALDSVMPLKPTPEVLSLHPSGDDGPEELMLIQVTRFSCGSLVVGFTTQHIVSDGRSTGNFFVAWSQATRGAAVDPVPVHDRASFFHPREPLHVEYEHRGVEFKPYEKVHDDVVRADGDDDEVVVNKVHFSREFISRLKAQAPLKHAVELISREVARINDGYFKSFIDFANSGAVEKERLAATADAAEMVLSPNIEVDSWLRIPFYDMDFGGGRPFFFMPSYLPVEGLLILLPSFLGDGSVDAYVPLFSRDMNTFKNCCYTLD